ncbi:MAG TPA: YggS family pyridoxal phosphate-dependent enzyme [Chloroflexota bacterium]|nr:YggS family pyridoxal phosphate-dependent enzyme [Chloroflexota bacterium]
MHLETARLSTLAERIEWVRQTIANAARRAGRNPDDVTLVAVSKTVSAEQILAATELGIRHFGENRVQEAEKKIIALADRLPSDVTWHLVGHLQSNKARTAMAIFAMIESVDSLRLATVLSRLAVERGTPASILLEVNVAGEASKFGFTPTALPNVLPAILSLPMLEVRGLMTVAPAADNPEEVRPVFRHLRELRNALNTSLPNVHLRELSMGMTNDFPVAIEEGATIVRVGRAIFGERSA